MVPPKSTAKADIALIRRERVSALLLRGLTQREIQEVLAKEGKLQTLNPDTKKPFDLATINRDIQTLREEHLQRSSENIDVHRARQFAELQELKRFAWETSNGKLALSALDKEMKLLGTAKGQDGIVINFNVELVVEVVAALRSTGADPEETFRQLIEAANARTTVSTDSTQ